MDEAEEKLPKAVYMVVSRDEYEFPLMICDTAKELAIKCGVRYERGRNEVCNAMSHAKKRGNWCQYRKVRIDYDDD